MVRGSLLLWLSLSLLCLISKPNDLDNLLLVQILEAIRCDHFIVILFSKKQTGLLEPLTVESISILEYLADTFDADVLSKNLLAALLERWHVESIS